MIPIKLINMPFASLTHPSLALGQFKAQLTSEYIPSLVHNFNFDFSMKMGELNYELLAKSKGFNSQLGEWLFSEQAWGKTFGPDEDKFWSQCNIVLDTLDGLKNPQKWLKTIKKELIPEFLDDCLYTLFNDQSPKVIAFTCTFFQTISSLALAKKIKEKYPEVSIVFGGACFHDEMGLELIKKCSFIDAVSIGEADDVFVDLIKSLQSKKLPEGLQGIVYRDKSGDIKQDAPHVPLSQQLLDKIPDPDFDEFFHDYDRTGLIKDSSLRERVFLPYESSRGCWWGEKQHCTFCGLNNDGLGYRQKSPDRVYKLLQSYADRYPVQRYDATDNILPVSYYKEFLPLLRDKPITVSGRQVQLFYEIKSNVTAEKVKLMSHAGIRFIQPGIESLSTHVLNQMRKGVKAIHNINLLKQCNKYGVYILWNLLYGFPGETEEDYDEISKIIPYLVHFQPPYGGPRKIELHRFSPYFFEERKDWIENIRPREWYKGLYPEEDVDIAKVAYYFECDWNNIPGNESYTKVIDQVWAWIDCWRDSPQLPRLVFQNLEDGHSTVTDTRLGRYGKWTLDNNETKILELLDDPTPFNQIWGSLKDKLNSKIELEEILNNFVENGIIFKESKTYLSLAVPSSVEPPPYNFRNSFFNKVGQRAQRDIEGKNPGLNNNLLNNDRNARNLGEKVF
jgi:ribosomal peptide maturation radical SAM protein 1